MNSIVSYPDRGRWGRADYRGNCSGHLIRDLIRFYKPKNVVDPAEGGGTTRDVCRDLRVPYRGFDLREGFNLAEDSLAKQLPHPAEFVFFHPPYFRIIQYSGSMWGDEPHPADLSHEEDWDTYLATLRKMVDNCLAAVVPNGRVAVLIGDVRQNGNYYSAQAAFHEWYGPVPNGAPTRRGGQGGAVIEAVLIKAQYRVASDKTEYAGSLIRIMHEYVIVLRGRAGHGRARP